MWIFGKAAEATMSLRPAPVRTGLCRWIAHVMAHKWRIRELRGQTPQHGLQVDRQREAHDLVQPRGGTHERLAVFAEKPRAVVFVGDVVGEPAQLVGFTAAASRSAAPGVWYSGLHMQSTSANWYRRSGNPRDALRDVVVVVRVVVDTGGHHDRPLDAALLHLVQ